MDLSFLSNRLLYRFFEVVLFLFIVFKIKDIFLGSLIEYILLATIEVGKNFATTIVKIPIYFGNFFYQREYQAAFVFLDSDLLLLLMLLLITKGYFKRRNKSLTMKIYPFDIFFLAFFIIVILSTIFSLNFSHSFLGLLQILRGVIIFFLFRFVNLQKIKKNLGFIFSTILIFQSVLGILQYLKKAPIGFIFETGQYLLPQGVTQQEGIYYFFRPTGTLTEPNLYALILNMLLPFSLLYFFYSEKKARRLFFGTSFLLGTTAVVLTFSRMGWFLYLIILSLLYKLYRRHFDNVFKSAQKIILKKRRYQFYFTSLLLFFLLFTVLRIIPRVENITLSLFEKWGSFNARLFLISESIKIIASYPFLGVGLFNFVPQMVKLSSIPLNEIYLSSVHNIYLLLASEVGIFGLLLLLLFLRSLLRKYIQVVKTISSRSKTLLDSLAISIFCFFFGGLFLSYFYAGIQLVFLMIILGMYANLLAEDKRHSGDPALAGDSRI